MNENKKLNKEIKQKQKLKIRKFKSHYTFPILTALSMVCVLIVEIIVGAILENIVSLVICVIFNMIWCFLLGIFTRSYFYWLEYKNAMEFIGSIPTDKIKVVKVPNEEKETANYNPFEGFEEDFETLNEEKNEEN